MRTALRARMLRGRHAGVNPQPWKIMNLDHVLLGNTLQAWIVAGGILAVSGLAIWVLQRFVLRALDRLARSTETGLDDLFAQVLRQTKLLLAFVVAAFAASLALELDAQVSLVVRQAAAIAVVVQGGIWASAAIKFWVDRFIDRAKKEDPAAVTTVSAVSFVGRLAVWSIVMLLMLDNLGVEVRALLTGLGIGGIAVALAAQNILGDLFASLSIILDKPFVMGDFLIVGDFKGSVEHVGLKTTRLRALGGEQLVIGNSDLVSTRLRNMGRMSDRRATFSIGVTYDTPREKLAAIPGWIREAVEAQPHTRCDRCHLSNFAASSIDFDVVFYMTVPEYATYMDEQQAIWLALHERFEREGVEFAYPTQVVYTIPAAAENADPR